MASSVLTESQTPPPSPAQGLLPAAPHLASLTGLRFVAAANVLAFHYAPHASNIDLANLPLVLYLLVLSGGAASVSLFFVLSGFVLAHRYIDDTGTFRGQQARFWLARLRRILPAYLLAYALALAWLWTHTGVDPTAAIATLGLVQAWWGPLARLVNSPAWSLSVEVFFYAAFPLLAPLVYRWAKNRPVLVVGGLLLASVPGPLVLGLVSSTDPSTSMTADFWYQTALNLPLFHLPSFLIGVATAAAFRAAPRGTARWPTIGELLPNLGALCCLVLISGTLPGPLVRDGALAPWFALLVLRLARGQGLVSRVLALPALVALGEASYALYILQEPLWNWFGTVLEWLGQGQGQARGDLSATWPGFALFVVLAVVLSIAIRRWWDVWLPRLFSVLSTSVARVIAQDRQQLARRGRQVDPAGMSRADLLG